MQEMQETWVQSLGQEDLLGEEMATPSSVLARRIPLTKKPGGLQSTGLADMSLFRSKEHTTQLKDSMCSLGQFITLGASL